MAVEGFDLSKLVKRAVGNDDVVNVEYSEIDLRPIGRVGLEEVQIAREIYQRVIKPVEDASGENEIIHRQLVYTAGMMVLGLVPDLGDRIVKIMGDDVKKLKKRRIDLFIGSAWKTWLIQAMFNAWLEGMGERFGMRFNKPD